MTDTRDRLTRFLLPTAGVRGVLVELDTTWREISARGDDPAPIQRLLGQACAAAAALTGHTKVEGRLSLQCRGTGDIRLLFAECTAAGTLRGIARRPDDAPAPNAQDLTLLGEAPTLAITIENPGIGSRDAMQYQGLVDVTGSSTLAQALESYFDRSEQLPTRLLLAADDQRAAALLLQILPGEEGDNDGWNRAALLFDTLTEAELLSLPGDAVLHRLFALEGVQTVGEKVLQFGCSCSRERVEAMLQSLGQEEAYAAAAAGEGGAAQIRCEFCGQRYSVDTATLQRLFAQPTAGHPAPDRLQ